MDSCLNASQSLIQCLPLNYKVENLQKIQTLIPQKYKENIFNLIARPLEIVDDTDEEIRFIKSAEYSLGESFRSPWSNQYFPKKEDTLADYKYPTKELREAELIFNYSFQSFAKLYYGNDVVTSVFLSSVPNGYDCCFASSLYVNHDKIENSIFKSMNATWDSYHYAQIMDVNKDKPKSALLYSFLHLTINGTLEGDFNFMDSLYSQSEVVGTDVSFISYPREEHLQYIGPLIEKAEQHMRTELEKYHIYHLCKVCRLYGSE